MRCGRCGAELVDGACLTDRCEGPKRAPRKKPPSGRSGRAAPRRIRGAPRSPGVALDRTPTEPIEKVETQSALGRRLVADLIDVTEPTPAAGQSEIIDIHTSEMVIPAPDDELATELLVFDRAVLDEDEALDGVTISDPDDEPLSLEVITSRAASGRRAARRSSTKRRDPSAEPASGAPPEKPEVIALGRRLTELVGRTSRAAAPRSRSRAKPSANVVEQPAATAKESSGTPPIVVRGRRLTELVARPKRPAANSAEVQAASIVVRCGKCGYGMGEPIPARCPNCRSRARPRDVSELRCKGCGRANPISAKTCARCHAPLTD
ncbi:MAG: hypothetical protein HYV07_09975 [Deltaproteobacteria bacterium]|nr:hypothetical protein [Deltaproteobacteria bacterium]